MEKRVKVINAIVEVVLKHYVWIIVLSVLLSVFSFYLSQFLSLKSDYIDLMDPNLDSVKKVRYLEKTMGGIGFMIVALDYDLKQKDTVAPDEFVVQLKRYIKDYTDELVKQFDKNSQFYKDFYAKFNVPPVQYIDYKIDNEFIEKNSLLLIKTEDLKELQKRIKKLANPFNLGLEDKSNEIYYKDIEDKYSSSFAQMGDKEYYISPNHNFLFIMIKGGFPSSNVAATEAVLTELDRIKDKLNPKSYHPNLRQRYTGTSLHTYQQSKKVSQDLEITFILAFLLISISTVLYFRKLSYIFYILLALLFSNIITYALIYVIFGYTNLVTAFLRSILSGLGIEFGVQFLSRYKYEVGSGKDNLTSIRSAFVQTGNASLTSLFTLLASFITIGFSGFAGFSEFGIIAAIGFTLDTLLMYGFISAMLKIFPSKIKHLAKLETEETHKISLKIFKYPKTIIACVSGLAIFFFIFSLSAKMEYNLLNLSVKDQESYVVEDDLEAQFNNSSNPGVFITESYDDAVKIQKIFDDPNLKQSKYNMVKNAMTLPTLVPPMEQQNENMKIINFLKRNIESPDIKVPEKDKETFNRLKKMVNVKPLKIEDLSEMNRIRFQGIAYTNSNIFMNFVYPDVKNFDFWDFDVCKKYVKMLKDVDLGNGKTVSITSSYSVTDDIISIIKNEGILFSILVLIVIFLILYIDFKNVWDVLVIIVPLILALFMTVGFMALIGMKLNFMNIIVIPVLMGSAVNYGIFLLHRFKSCGSIIITLTSTGKAILICAVNAVLGWLSLLYTPHQGLQSMSHLAIIGYVFFILCFFTIMPAVLELFRDKFIPQSKN